MVDESQLGMVFDTLKPFGPFVYDPTQDPLNPPPPTPLDPARLAAAQAVLATADGAAGWSGYWNGLRGYFYTAPSGYAIDCGPDEAMAMLRAIRPDLAVAWQGWAAGLPMPATSSLVDAFSGSQLGAVWSASFGGAAESAGRVTIPTVAGYAGLVATPMYAFDSVYMKIVPAPQPGNGSIQTIFEVVADSKNKMQFALESTGLVMVSLSGGTTTTSTVTYSPTAMAYWRLAAASGQFGGSTLSWATSPDASTWTTQWSQSSVVAPWSAVTVDVASGFTGTESSPGPAYVYRCNTP